MQKGVFYQPLYNLL